MVVTWRLDADGYHRATDGKGDELGWVCDGDSVSWWARGPAIQRNAEEKLAHRRGGADHFLGDGYTRHRFSSRDGFADTVAAGKKAVERRLDMLWGEAA